MSGTVLFDDLGLFLYLLLGQIVASTWALLVGTTLVHTCSWSYLIGHPSFHYSMKLLPA